MFELCFLYTAFNELTCSIPTELGNLNKLESIYLNDNNLSGTIPTELVKLKFLSAKASVDAWKLNKGDIVVRTCRTCTYSHRTIVYKRLTAPGSIDFRALFLDPDLQRPTHLHRRQDV